MDGSNLQLYHKLIASMDLNHLPQYNPKLNDHSIDRLIDTRTKSNTEKDEEAKKKNAHSRET